MSENTQDTSVRTRPDQLLADENDRVVSLQGFLQVLGFDPNGVDGVLGDDTKSAYSDAREQHGFLPELSADPQPDELSGVFSSIDRGLQEDVAFQRQFVVGINAEEDVTSLQGALVAGGSWANRHLGDRISEAEAINIDGERGILTDRGVRNAASLTGVSGVQASLNLLTDAGLETDGVFGSDTNDAMRAYATDKGIELTDNAQDNFTAVREYIQQNEGDALRNRVSEALNADEDMSSPDAATKDAQIVMNEFARQAGSNTRTAPDSLQTDSQITADMSHTRTVIAPEVGIDVDEPAPEIVCTAPMVDRMYEITRNDVVADAQSIIDQQASNPDYPNAVLAYSDEANSYVLVTRDENLDMSRVYQISDRNVDQIADQVADGSIAMDISAQKVIADRVHGNASGTEAYSTDDLRTAFTDRPERFTSDTRESLLTTSVHSPADGTTIVMGLDDLHDGLDKMDSKHDWEGHEDPIAIREFVKDLRQATEDAREERPVTVPVWDGGELDDSNSVEIDIGGEMARVPSEVYMAVAGRMSETETGFDFAENAERGATRIDDFHIDSDESSAFTDIHLAGRFDQALAAEEPLMVDPMEPALEQPAVEDTTPEVQLAENEATTDPAAPGTAAPSTMGANM